VLEYNLRIQRQNNAPSGFPGFVREKFDVKIIGDGYESNADGLIWKDFALGSGDEPKDGQVLWVLGFGYRV
jgi:hypothetical protein